MTDISAKEKLLATLVAEPHTIDWWAYHLRRIYGSSGLRGDKIKMARGTFDMSEDPRGDRHRPRFYFVFHTAEDKRRWEKSDWLPNDNDKEVQLWAHNVEELVAQLKKINQKPKGKVRKIKPRITVGCDSYY